MKNSDTHFKEMKKMANNEKTGIPYLRYGAMAVLFLLLMVPGILADEYVGGVPPQTVQTGTVSGDLYVDASLASFSADVEKTFAAIPDVSDIDWARLYVAVYCGHMQNNYNGNATVSFDGNGDGIYETALGTEDLNVSYVYEVYGGTTPVVVNDHCNRVTSDYLMWYDVTSLITSQTPKAHVETAKVNPSFDGRIKALTLVVAYNDGDSDLVHYWVNQGHDVDSSYADINGTPYTGVSIFDLSGISGTIESATLTVNHLAGTDGTYAWNGDPIPTDPATGNFQGDYYGYNIWNVTSGVITEDINDLTYDRVDSYYKITLAMLAVKEAACCDLEPTFVNPDAATVFAKETNRVRVNVKNNGPDESPVTEVRLTSDDGVDVRGTVPAIASGATEIVYVIDPTIRTTEGGTVTYTVTVDPDNAVPETDEDNNEKDSLARDVKFNGYKGKRYWDDSDVTTKRAFDLRGGLLYSSGNSTYKQGGISGGSWTDYTVTWTSGDLPVPAGAAVEEARLYVPYTWDNSSQVPDHFSVTFNGNVLPNTTWYRDESNYGGYDDYFYGLLAYDVTSYFSAGGNSADIHKDDSGSNLAMYGLTLAVVYTDENATRKQIFLNEEFDLLGADATMYATTPEEATAYVPFSGMTIDTADVICADLITFVPSGNGPEGDLLFNGATLATDVWDYGSASGTQVAVDSRDVKASLLATGNEAAIRSTDGSTPVMAASHVFLVVEYEDAGAADLVVTEILPNVGAGADLFANEPNVLSVNVTNIGDAEAGPSTLQVDIGGSEYTTAVGSLAAGAYEIVTVTDTVSRLAGQVTVTATADSTDVIDESNETNNNMTVDLTVYNNGYKGKRWTDGNDLTTQATFDGQYDVVYSAGDTAYAGASWTESTYNWTSGDLPIPSGATVVEARLYQGYTYNKMGVDPAYTMTFNGATVTPGATYQDIKGFGSYSYPYGMYVYDVTSEFDPAGNSMTITPETGNNYGIYGAYLVVVYEDDSAARKAIWINEEFDMLYSRSSYSVNDTEATAYAPFSGVDATGMEGATAVAILASAGDADKSAFFFNSQEYTGFWNDYLGGPQVGFSVYDVTGAIAAGENFAGLQSFDPGSNGDNMYATTAILVVEYTEEPGYPVMLGTGWSLFSTPVLLSDDHDSFEEIFADVPPESLQLLLGWGDGQWYIPDADAALKPLDAYYIKTTEPVEVYLFPSTAVSSIPSRALPSGITLIGPAPACEEGEFAVMPVEEALISIREAPGGLTGYTIVVSPAHNQPSWVHVVGGDSRDILPFKGYWVVMENPDTLYGFSTTPVG
jgi:hypothetical protein